MHFQSTKLSSVKLPPYYDHDACNTTFLGMFCHIVKVLNVPQWWGSHVFRSLDVISTLEHAGEP